MKSLPITKTSFECEDTPSNCTRNSDFNLLLASSSLLVLADIILSIYETHKNLTNHLNADQAKHISQNQIILLKKLQVSSILRQ